MNILLVEDDPRLAALIKRGLEEEQMVLTVASDGLQGLELALAQPFELIILDVMLPHRNGLEVLAAIREQDALVPVLLLTALGTTTDKLQGFGGGADDYLVKPFDFAELVARVRALGRRGGTQPKGARLAFADVVLDVPSCTVTRAGRALRLTARLPANGARRGLPGSCLRSTLADHKPGSAREKPTAADWAITSAPGPAYQRHKLGFRRSLFTHLWFTSALVSCWLCC